MKVKAESVAFIIFGLYVLSAPIAYIPDVQRILPGIPFTFLLHLVVLLSLSIFYAFYSRLIFPVEAKIILVAFALPSIFSTASLYFHLLDELPFYIDATIVFKEYVTRVISLFVNILIFTALIGYAFSTLDRLSDRLMRFYFATLFVLVLGGIWQFASFHFGLPFLDLSVKSHFHGVGEEIKAHYGSRLTSFFAEPSYFVAFVLDFLILSFILIKKRWILGIFISSGVFVLVASYSMSGMLNAIMLIVAAVIVSIFATNLGRVENAVRAILLIIALATIIMIGTQGVDVLEPYYDRIEHKLSMGSDQRIDIIRSAFATWMEHDLVTQLFGFGSGTFALFKYQSVPMAGTSNNLYIDILIEHGLTGLVAIILFFGYLIVKGLMNVRSGPRQFVGIMLVLHLAISSMYRADFASPRFWVVLFIVMYLLRSQNDVRGKQLIDRKMIPCGPDSCGLSSYG